MASFFSGKRNPANASYIHLPTDGSWPASHQNPKMPKQLPQSTYQFFTMFLGLFVPHCVIDRDFHFGHDFLLGSVGEDFLDLQHDKSVSPRMSLQHI